MKQQLLLVIFTFFVGLTTAQNKESLSYSIYEEYDSYTKEYSDAMKQVYAYNSNAQLKMVTYFYKDGADWIESIHNEFKYNDDGNLAEESFSTKMSAPSEWVNVRKNVTHYDGSRVTRQESFEWENGNWKPDEKTVLNYVGNKIKTSDTSEWNGTQWVDDSRSVITYDGNKIETVTTEDFENGVWTLHDKDTYTKSSANRIKEYMSQDWDGTGWTNDEKIGYNDDTKGNRITMTSSYSQDGIAWELEDRTVYDYDYTALMSDYINPFSADSFSISLGVVDVPHYNKVISNVEYSYDESDWEVSGRTTYYYKDETMGLNDLSKSNFVTIYPNPVKNTLNIKFKDQVQADASLFDINGRLVLNQKLQALSTSLNIEPLNSGIYVLKIRTEDGFATKRITKN